MHDAGHVVASGQGQERINTYTETFMQNTLLGEAKHSRTPLGVHVVVAGQDGGRAYSTNGGRHDCLVRDVNDAVLGTPGHRGASPEALLLGLWRRPSWPRKERRLLLGGGVFREHLLGAALGDDCHLLFFTLHCVLVGHHAFVEHQSGQLRGRSSRRRVGPDLPPVLPLLPPLGAALPRVLVATAASVHPSGYPPSNTKTPAVSSERVLTRIPHTKPQLCFGSRFLATSGPLAPW